MTFDRQDGVLEAARGEIGGVNPVLQHAGSPKLQPSASSGLKQSISPRKERMDCFVARAPRNDVERDAVSHSRGTNARGLNVVPLDEREQGMPGARCTRGLVC